MNFTFRQIRYFVAVADSFSVSRAAAELHLIRCSRRVGKAALVVGVEDVEHISTQHQIAEGQDVIQRVTCGEVHVAVPFSREGLTARRQLLLAIPGSDPIGAREGVGRMAPNAPIGPRRL